MLWMPLMPRASLQGHQASEYFRHQKRGHAKLLDFGLAKWAEPVRAPKPNVCGGETRTIDEQHLTSPGTTLGTVAYTVARAGAGQGTRLPNWIFSRSARCCTRCPPAHYPFRGDTSALIFNAILKRNHPCRPCV